MLALRINIREKKNPFEIETFVEIMMFDYYTLHIGILVPPTSSNMHIHTLQFKTV